MASPIATGGFDVRTLPHINFADPRLIAPNYGDLIPAAAQGAAFVENLSSAPLRKRLAEIQLAQNEARLAAIPIEAQIRNLELGEAQRRAALPNQIIEGVDITGGTRGLPDITGTFEEGITYVPGAMKPLVRTTRGTEVLAGGQTRPFTREETLKTGRQVESEESKAAAALENQESLIASREAAAKAAEERLRIQEEFNKMKAESDRIKAEAAAAKAQQLANNPAVGFVDVKKADGRTYRQYFPKGNPSQIIHEVDRGQLMSFGDALMMSAFGGLPQGGGLPAMTPAAAQSTGGNRTQEDIEAYSWALSNPDDPRSAQILKKLGAQ